MSSPLERYLRDLHAIHTSGAGTPELAYYSPLETLLSSIGEELSPEVRCIMGLADQGAGLPDGGLFTEDQLQGDEPRGTAVPARGVIEVKPTTADARTTAQGEQVRRYLEQYRLVLVTTYREFVLMGLDPAGTPTELDAYTLAQDAESFWQAAGTPRATATAHDERFTDFLKRVLLHAAPLAAPKDVAWFLASYAREALARVEGEALPALDTVRDALEEALGLTFQGERGDHFFRSTLVQTLFYGTFSAWVLWSKQHPPQSEATFNWHDTPWLLHVPMIQALFEQVAAPSKIGPQGLRLSEILDRTQALLNRVDRAGFFARFEEGQAVQYFYEPFLEAFDPELRKQLGVWYTPPEVVKYMVARVDTVLREELGLAGGLANPQVHVLDPCCGTGAYLVEVLRTITETLGSDDALSSYDVKRAATSRVFGFELLPAPFVIAHLQLGLLLQNLGSPLGDDERAGVYLTNALTGWEPPDEPKQRVLFPELAEERDAAERVKQETPILVVLGNPPYNGYAGVAVDEERDLTDAYRETERAPAPQGQGLNDLYVRFYRMAERRIVEQTGRGVVCFISNYSWLDGLSFTGMRERYLDVFDRLWIDNLHGDRIISEYNPEGKVSETVFARRGTSPGIKVGTAIATMVRQPAEEHGECDVLYRDHHEARAAERRYALLETTNEPDINENYKHIKPALKLGLPLKPREAVSNYFTWPLLTDLLPVSFPGIQTSRADVVVDIDRNDLIWRMEKYFDPHVSHEEMRQIVARALSSTKRFDAEETREYLHQRGFLPENIVRYCYRPFDVRWLYWEPETKLLDEKRAEYFPQVFEGNVWMGAAQRNRRGFDPPLVSAIHCSRHIVERGANLFPLKHKLENEGTLFATSGNPIEYNLSQDATRYLKILENPESQIENVFYHIIAVLHSPRYCEENAGALQLDWPRVPLPETGDLLRDSAALGRRLATLLDPEQDASTLIAGAPFGAIGPVTREGGGPLDPNSDLALTAGWGYTIRSGTVTMPGQGTLTERDYTQDERDALAAGADALEIDAEQVLDLLGERTTDVWLNDVAYWRNVPAAVWGYTLGGYPVIKKWLSYREERVLGRALRPKEVREVTEMARRIAAIVLMGPALDANYAAVKRAGFEWPPRL